LIIAIILIVAAAIIIPIVLSKSNNPEPTPKPIDPIFYNVTNYNPYYITNVIDNESEIKGHLYTKDPYQPN
jgi:hypothetical protein